MTAVSVLEHEPFIPALIDAWVAGYREVEPRDLGSGFTAGTVRLASAFLSTTR